MTLTSGQSRVKPISAFALISWGAHGHTHASQTTSLTRLLIPHLGLSLFGVGEWVGGVVVLVG